jgi:hypothetical protein
MGGSAKESVSRFEAKWSEGRSCFCELKQGRTRAKTERKNRRTLSRQKGRGFKFVVFSTTNLNLLFRQIFLISCVWLKTVRWQSIEFTILLAESIKKAVHIVSLHFLVLEGPRLGEKECNAWNLQYLM